MITPDRDLLHPSRRSVVLSGAALLGAGLPAAAASPDPVRDVVPPPSPPAGYNILFVLVDQEHFFPSWPFPVPGREWIARHGITFVNHQAASCACSPARSTLYTGQHIQHSGVFDNLNAIWQPDMAPAVRTIGHRLAGLGYHASYFGKWHLSANLDTVKEAVDAPLARYREIIGTYGFADFFGVGDLTDRGLGGYTYDDATTAAAASWLRTTARSLHESGKPWFVAVNFVNPHDVMYVDSDLPGQAVQGARALVPIFRPPEEEIYAATWEDVPLPATRGQAFDAPGRPAAHRIYQGIQDLLVGTWPDEDRRWRILRDYYFNCIRDCDRQVTSLLEVLKQSGMADRTIIVFTADHGELGGAHQMRGKGNCTYRQQNHIPLMVVHPAYPAGQRCRAVTSQIDLAPTLLALTGAETGARAAAATGLLGRDFSGLLASPEAAAPDALRPAALFNFNMLTYQDVAWSERMFFQTPLPAAEKVAVELKDEPDFHDRCAIRSVFDGRYRFSRYFSPLDFNRPTTWEALAAHNDLELYDLVADPEETANLAADRARHGDLVLAMNAELNARLDEEVGADDGSFLPIRNGKWHFPRPDQR
jgi:arylsulfatase A-like enzyme